MQLLFAGTIVWLMWHLACLRLLFRRLHRFAMEKMDCDELIDELLAAQGAETSNGTQAPHEHAEHAAEEPSQPPLQSNYNIKHRERLAALVAGGQAKQYLGKTFTIDQIDSLSDDEVEKLYARYEAGLGAAMTRTLGSAAIGLYAGVASMFLPIKNPPALIADLEGDPFVEHALSSATCELYHRYGMFLAPLTTVLTTLKHCQFGHHCPIRMTDDDAEDVRERASAREDVTEREPTTKGASW